MAEIESRAGAVAIPEGSVEIREGRGRCFISNRDFAPGEIVLAETPYSFVVADVQVGRGSIFEVSCCPSRACLEV